MKYWGSLGGSAVQRQVVPSPLACDSVFALAARARGSGVVGTRVTRLGMLLFCLLVSMLMLPVTAMADPLAGTVVGKDGNPRPFVRIDIIGPQNVVIVADENGRFAIDVPKGRYKVRVTDNRRRMDFQVSSPVEGEKFRLSW